MKVILKKMSLRNFKGIRDLDIEFRADTTNILGANGTGKTTIFDAFTWCLFGKDSRDRENFQLMTLDSDGTEIPRLNHEVTLVLMIDGREVTLTRRKNEKWTKKRGTAAETKTGTEEIRLYNDIPCSVAEWNEKIQAICPYDVFKNITSPTYFCSLKPKVQRDFLFGSIGATNDVDLARKLNNNDFLSLLNALNGKTIDEFKREISVKQKRIKTELEEYPIRIKECNNVIDGLSDIDFVAIKKEIADKKVRLAEINESLSSASASANKQKDKLEEIKTKLSTLRLLATTREFNAESELSAAHYEAKKRVNDLMMQASSQQAQIDFLKGQKDDKTRTIQRMQKRREELIAEREKIKSERLAIPDGTFVCPTCGRPLSDEESAKTRRELEERLNAKIAERLEANKQEGLKCGRQVIAQLQSEVAALEVKIKDAAENIAKLNKEREAIVVPALPLKDDVIRYLTNSSTEYQTLQNDITELSKSLSNVSVTDEDDANLSELSEARELLQSSLEELSRLMGKKEIIDERAKLIVSYEEQMRNKAEELATLERMEFTIASFIKAKIDDSEEKINNLFSFVRFKMFKYQLNGGYEETCEAMVDGVPYSSLNNAMRINAGLDIINALCRHYDTYAPIFVDNAESVNELILTDSQLIRLVVTDDAKIKIQ